MDKWRDPPDDYIISTCSVTSFLGVKAWDCIWLTCIVKPKVELAKPFSSEGTSFIVFLLVSFFLFLFHRSFFFSLLGRDSPFSISFCFYYYYYYYYLFKKWCLFGSKQFSIRSICLDSASTFCILHFFFFLLAPLALLMSHKQCIKVNEQCFVSVNSNRKFMFLLFLFFSKISGIQMPI